MRTRTKVLILIALAILFSWLFGCAPSREHYVPVMSTAGGDTSVEYLQQLYITYNYGYFHNRLPTNVTIDLNEKTDMASTSCKNDACVLSFNPKYVAAPRVADFTMLHEQCHVKTWGLDEKHAHGKVWRACMIQLDMEGAFRQIIIDDYREEM
jgi:hypothetical protein